MLQYIKKHYTEKISLENIANSATISKSEASRCFELALHTSPIETLIHYRLASAKEEIITTKDSITEIALRNGFESCSYFNRSFKNHYGFTPTQIRK